MENGVRSVSPIERRLMPEGEVERRIAMLELGEQIAGIGSYVWDFRTGELQWSDHLYRLFGMEPGALQPTPENVLERVFADDRDRVRQIVETAVSTGQLAAFEFRITPAEGALRCLQATVAAIDEEDGVPHRFVGTVQDVTASRQIAREVAGHIAIEEVLATWVDMDRDAERLLARLGTAKGFSAGVLWLRREGGLSARSIWTSDSSGSVQLDTGDRPLRPGRTPPLAVAAWLSREPVIVVDLAAVPPFAGRDAAIHSDLQGAMAIPAVSDGEVLAVLEFYSREILQPTETLLRSLTGMGYELGHFFSRRRGELRPRELTGREREILHYAAQGMSVKAIASELTLSSSTVKTHFEHIYAKWGVSDRAAAVARALREGLIR